MTQPRDLSSIVCANCDEVILICTGIQIAEEFSVKCAACALRSFYRAADLRTAGRNSAQRRSA